MDGIEVAQRLKARPLAKPPHLVMVTAYGREEVLRGAEAAGMHASLGRRAPIVQNHCTGGWT